MSIDDAVGRDPRITMLATMVGWSRREVVGCLVCDVWPIAYDQGTHLVSERVIDAAAGHAGFGAAMIEVGLAKRDRSGKLAISGAKQRIEYLAKKSRAGHEGGVKSAQVRARKSKQTSSTAGSTTQARRNPPVPDPDPPPVLVPDPVSDPVPAEEEAERAPRGNEAAAASSPVGRITMPVWPEGAYSATNPTHRGRLAESVWRALSDARLAIGADLGLTPLPLPPLGVGGQTRGMRDLLDRIRLEGALAPMVCTNVLSNLVADAKETQSLDWLSEKAFSEGSWQHSRDAIARGTRAPPKQSGAVGAASPRSDHAESHESVEFGDMLAR
jgi:hypothetical protein